MGNTSGKSSDGPKRTFPLPESEERRLKALHESGILHSPAEAAFDALARVAAAGSRSPMSGIYFVSEDSQWAKSRVGPLPASAARGDSFCAHVLLNPKGVLEVEDAQSDSRFSDSTYVQQDGGIRFYVGAPILSEEGDALGTLCVADTRPRRADPIVCELVQDLARTAGGLVQARRALRRASADTPDPLQLWAYKALFEAAPNLFLVLKPDAPRYTIVTASDAYLRATLKTREQIVGRGLYEAFPANPEDQKRHVAEDTRASYDRVLATRLPHQMPLLKYDVLSADGKTYVEKFWQPLNTPVLGPDGQVQYIIHRVEDVTEAIQLQHRELVNRAMLDNVLEEMPSGVIAVDMKGGVLLHNRAAQALSGVSAAAIGDGTPWSALFGLRHDDGTALKPDEVPLARALAGTVVSPTPLLMKRGDGTDDLHIEASARPLRDPSGEQTGAVVVFTDVDARARAEAALRESEARYRALFEVSPLLLWTASPEGHPDYYNQSAIDYFGVPAERIVREGWRQWVHPEDMADVQERWTRSLQREEALVAEFRLRRHDGHYRWIQARAQPLRDVRGNLIKWIGANTDIDDLKRAQREAETATEAKSQFLANMSHEIRTPMNGVIGMTSLLQGTPLTATQAEYVNTIRASGEHLLALINDILDFSKAEAGLLELERYAFNLRGCVEEAMDLVSALANNKSLELILDMAPNAPKCITGDAGRLRQVLVNLLSNAIKFTPAGEVLVRVDVTVEATEDGAWRLRFSIQDSGIGIPADRMDRLFGMFSQVDASHTRTFGGSGLGLAICKRLVERMGGRIWADSAPGVGSTFHFEIEAGPAPDDLQARAIDFGGRHALLVDDNATNRRVLRLMLESWGFVVTDVDRPLIALDALRQQHFDVGLLDYHMPQMTGVELGRLIKRTDAFPELPLLLLGSMAGVEDVDGPLFAAQMLKPIRQSTLFDQLAIVFGRTSRSREITTVSIDPELGTRHPLRILVAEDNTVNQKVASRFLEKLGYRADFVSNGLEAVQAATRQDYDVILMDLQMPELDGFEATREIQRLLPTPPSIIALTANALAGDERRCLDAGMQGYLSNPLDIRHLSTALTKVSGRADDVPPMGMPADPGKEVVAPEMESGSKGMAKLVAMFGEADARELIATYIVDLPIQLAELRDSIAQGDLSRAARVAHTLRSTSALAGEDELVALCKEAERAFLTDSENASRWAEAMAVRYQALVEDLSTSAP